MWNAFAMNSSSLISHDTEYFAISDKIRLRIRFCKYYFEVGRKAYLWNTENEIPSVLNWRKKWRIIAVYRYCWYGGKNWKKYLKNEKRVKSLPTILVTYFPLQHEKKCDEVILRKITDLIRYFSFLKCHMVMDCCQTRFWCPLEGQMKMKVNEAHLLKFPDAIRISFALITFRSQRPKLDNSIFSWKKWWEW